VITLDFIDLFLFFSIEAKGNSTAYSEGTPKFSFCIWFAITNLE
jgi:hypothetical protein